MTLNSRDRTPTSPSPVPPPRRRTTAAQRVLFTIASVFACLTVTLFIAQLKVSALVMGGVTVAVVSQLLTGVRKKPGKRARFAGEGFSLWRWRRQPDDPGSHTAESYGHGHPAAGIGEETALAPRNGGPPGQPQLPGEDPSPGPPARTAEGLDPSHRTKPDPPPAHRPAEPDRRLPGPPVFAGASAAGRAPWHLPVGSAPSGLAADAARLGDLEVRAASMVGAGHRCEEPACPRQDAYALGRTPDGNFLIIAVADGVSQSPRSDLGARVAVTAATRELGKMLASGGMPAIDVGLLYNIVVGEMLGTGRDRGLRDDDICSILIVAVIPAVPRSDGTRQLWTSWIGDVSMWILRNGVLHRATGMEKTGLDRNALSAVLPFNPDQAEQTTLDIYPRDRVAVVTDGVSDTLSSFSGAIEYFAREWSNPAPHPAAFLHSLCYDGPGQTDDRTAVVVWCGVGRQPGQAAPHGRQA